MTTYRACLILILVINIGLASGAGSSDISSQVDELSARTDGVHPSVMDGITGDEFHEKRARRSDSEVCHPLVILIRSFGSSDVLGGRAR